MDLKKKLKRYLPHLMFCLAAGLISTLWGYNYSSGNADEQLPFIFRAMDPAYLSNDFFTNTFSLYGPRTIYSEFIAFLAKGVPLTYVLFLLTYFSNAFLAFFSSLTALHLYKDSRIGAFLAAASVLTLKAFWLGYSNIIYRNFLEPAHLAMPFLLLGFYLVLKRRFIFSALSFGIATLFHPLMGIETGGLIFGIVFIIQLLEVVYKKVKSHQIIPTILGFGVISVFSLSLLLPYTSQQSISDELFIQLVAYVRHPHHYLPSTFGWLQYGQAAVFLLSFGIIFWVVLKKSQELKKQKYFLFLLGASILLLCVGGYLFVEIWPSRLWITAQTFRLPYLIKWFGLVLMAAWAGDCIERPAEGEKRLEGFIAGFGLVTPISLAGVVFVTWFRKVILPRLKFRKILSLEPAFLVVVITAIFLNKPDLRTWALYVLLFGSIWIAYLFKWKFVGNLISTGILILCSGLFIFWGSSQYSPRFLKSEVPVFSLYDDSTELASVAEYARMNTPKDAIFLTPPKFGEFRYIANRAIVVDFTAFAFQDQAMAEWFSRIVDCYGTPLVYGFNNIAEFNRVYRDKSDEELVALAKKYDARYIILFNSDTTKFPILFSTTSYKLIQILN